jgi:hypothetical protein
MDIRIVRGAPDEHDVAALVIALLAVMPDTLRGPAESSPTPSWVHRAIPYASPASWRGYPTGR